MRREVIKKIEELDTTDFSGYRVTTNKQKIEVLIDNDSQCCENWGYMMSEDDTSEFIGAKINTITMVDDALNTRVLDFANRLDDGVASCMFVNINTDKGTLQIVVYNGHNGYYSHAVKVKSKQLEFEGHL
jgi:hypothetical protein